MSTKIVHPWDVTNGVTHLVATITYPEMEHLAKPLHHAIKTALFPLFYQVVTKILNEDSKKSPIKWTLCMQSRWKPPYFIGYGTRCRSTTVTLCHILSHCVTNRHGSAEPGIRASNSPAKKLLIFLNVAK